MDFFYNSHGFVIAMGVDWHSFISANCAVR
jgi:hypothetical protein